jgi:hypothetical protein
MAFLSNAFMPKMVRSTPWKAGAGSDHTLPLEAAYFCCARLIFTKPNDPKTMAQNR